MIQEIRQTPSCRCLLRIEIDDLSRPRVLALLIERLLSRDASADA